MHPIFKADECGAHNWIMIFTPNEENSFNQVVQAIKGKGKLIQDKKIDVNNLDFELLMDDYIEAKN